MINYPVCIHLSIWGLKPPVNTCHHMLARTTKLFHFGKTTDNTSMGKNE